MKVLPSIAAFCALFVNTALADELPELRIDFDASSNFSNYETALWYAQANAVSNKLETAMKGAQGAEIKPLVNPAYYHEVKISDDLVDAVRATMAYSLRDPYSARFTDLRAKTNGNEVMITACGQINAKNALGAYVGLQPFAVIFANPHAKLDKEPLIILGEPWIKKGCEVMGIG